MKEGFKGIWIPKHICNDNNLNTSQKYVMGILLGLSKNNDKESCYPSNKTLSELLNISIRGIQKILKSLEEINYIEIDILPNNKRIIYITSEEI